MVVNYLAMLIVAIVLYRRRPCPRQDAANLP
jgi:hypothetical protein